MAVQELVVSISESKQKLVHDLKDHMDRVLAELDWAIRGFEVLGAPIPQDLTNAYSSVMNIIKEFKQSRLGDSK